MIHPRTKDFWIKKVHMFMCAHAPATYTVCMWEKPKSTTLFKDVVFSSWWGAICYYMSTRRLKSEKVPLLGQLPSTIQCTLCICMRRPWSSVTRFINCFTKHTWPNTTLMTKRLLFRVLVIPWCPLHLFSGLNCAEVTPNPNQLEHKYMLLHDRDQQQAECTGLIALHGQHKDITLLAFVDNSIYFDVGLVKNFQLSHKRQRYNIWIRIWMTGVNEKQDNLLKCLDKNYRLWFMYWNVNMNKFHIWRGWADAPAALRTWMEVEHCWFSMHYSRCNI